MKLDQRRVDAFLRDPGAIRLALLHGEDHGLIRARATALVRAVAGSIDDPFDVVELDRGALANFSAEMASQSLTGRRRVVRVREATDAATEFVKKALQGTGGGFGVLEAGALPSRSKLRALVEQAADAQAIACYPLEGAQAAALASSVLAASSVTADEDALRFLTETVAGDQALLRCETEKLALFVGAGGRADVTAAMMSVGDMSGLSVEDALFAATSGEIGRTDRAVEAAFAEGASPVGMLRAALMHVHRLLQARLDVDGGTSASDAVRRLRPPVYAARAASLTRAVAAGSRIGFKGMATRLGQAERACKRTGAPAESLARHALIAIARQAGAGRGR